MDNSAHYDSITEAWQYILGGHFHWGLFANDTNDLREATINLTDLMISLVDISPESKVIDIGCGIGNPAIYLYNRFRCDVTGISNSPRGVDTSTLNAAKNTAEHKVRFLLADALSNRFEDNTFDVAWLLEMSHLIHEKDKLIAEAVRVLKPGGQIVLCDLMFKRSITAREITDSKADLIKLEKSFGQAKMETMQHYKDIFCNNRLTNVVFADITDQVKKTPECWKQNVIANHHLISPHLHQDAIDNFIESCDILTRFYNHDIWGYGIIRGDKWTGYE